MRLLELSDPDEVSLSRDYVGDTPKYGILSHRWASAEDELSFQDLVSGRGKKRPGYAKVLGFGRQARRDGLKHFWVDASCINKASSTELSEAVLSMFRWYREAAKCYVYLSDVQTQTWERDFARSKWFKRGWTLQELVAPSFVEFYSNSWELLGNRTSLRQELRAITQIPVRALQSDPLSTLTIAERVSWAAHQSATRWEDLAYCQVGISDVSVHPIYEGGQDQAISRFHDEIRSKASGMRLLESSSKALCLDKAASVENLQYAILSHTWGTDEVFFEDMRNATAERKFGYRKIGACCDLAAKRGFDYIWVDTCCIEQL